MLLQRVPNIVNDTVEVRPRSLLTEAQWHSIAETLHMSPRETEVLQYIFDGEKELAIAQELGISSHTVHSHVKRIYLKLGVHGHSELIVRIFSAYFSLESTRPTSGRCRHTD